MAINRAGASRPGIGSLGRPRQSLGGWGLASAIFRMTAGVCFPSFASVTSRSLAAATCAGVTAMTRRFAMSASGDRITTPSKRTYLTRSLGTCKPDAGHRTMLSEQQAHNVASMRTLNNNWDPEVTIGIGTLTISQPLWSTRRDWQDASCTEPYRNRGPETVRQGSASASPMRLGGESGP